MDLEDARALPVVGGLLFREPQRDAFSWAFFVFTVLLTVWMTIGRGPAVGFLAGGSLVTMAVPNVLPEHLHLPAVVLRIVGLAWFVGLWIGIWLYFPSAPAFFEGNW